MTTLLLIVVGTYPIKISPRSSLASMQVLLIAEAHDREDNCGSHKKTLGLNDNVYLPSFVIIEQNFCWLSTSCDDEKNDGDAEMCDNDFRLVLL